ncbi:MAG: hypothetical protein ACREAM_22150 [Blastocatellia bacterium]
MRITRKVAPGQKGAKRLLDQYGAKLLCVRYRYDSEKRKRFKTIELIIEACPGFQPTWQEHLDWWKGEEPGAYNDTSEFARYLVEPR